jgi:hypothetical protein
MRDGLIYRLLETPMSGVDIIACAQQKVDDLEAQRDALLAACKMVLDDPGLTASANDVIRGAIEKAEGA